MKLVNKQIAETIDFNDFSACGASSIDSMDSTAFEKSSFSKWSDGSFEMPFVPSSKSNASTVMVMPIGNDRRQKDLPENSYSFYDARSMQVVSSGSASGNVAQQNQAFNQMNTKGKNRRA